MPLSENAENALRDLLRVRDLSEISPTRLQAWQRAARALVDVDTAPPPPSPSASDEATS